MQINLFLDKLNASQEAFLNLRAANAHIGIDDVAVFTKEQVLPVIEPKVACFDIECGIHRTGLTIFNSLELARFSKCTRSEFNVLYIWEPEWLFTKRDYLEDLQNTKKLTIVCKSDNHARVVKNYFNRKPLVLDFNIKAIQDAVCSR